MNYTLIQKHEADRQTPQNNDRSPSANHLREILSDIVAQWEVAHQTI
ncbi:hypothetical protein NC981_18365 [Leptolyngbya sp. DQ-M1]